MERFKALFAICMVMLLTVAFVTPNAVAEETEWKRELTLGFNYQDGNTEKSALSLTGAISKQFDASEFSSKFDISQSSSSGKTDSQKWISTTRYAFDFGDNNDWFNSYTFQVDHDKFSAIDYRILPSVGIGRWLSREDDWTWSVEGGLGYEITNYNDGTPDEESASFIARTFLKKKIFDNSFISEDLSVIPSLEGEGVRIKSTTEFTNPLRENLDLSVKYIVDYDSEPSAGKEETDTQIITGIKYAF